MSDVKREEIGDAPPIRRDIMLGTLAVLGAPLMFLVALNVRYMLVQPACASLAGRVLLELGTLIVLLFAAAVVLRAWRALRGEVRSVEAGAAEQPRFLATSALLLGAFSLLAGLALWAPSLFFSPCGRP